MPTWTDTQITRWTKDAEEDIIARVFSRFYSFSIPIVEGTATYTINHRIHKIVSVQWKSKPLSPYISQEPHAIVPKFRELSGESVSYIMSNDGITTLRLIPVPNQDIPQYDTGLYSDNIENAFIIRAYVFPDRTVDHLQLPNYLSRNLIKCYVLYRAFNAEGIGQNQRAAKWWKARYEHLIETLRDTKSRYFQTEERLDLDEDAFSCQKKRLPYLPPDFIISKGSFPLFVGEPRDSLNNWLDSVNVDLAVDPSFLFESVEDSLDSWQDAVALVIQGHQSRSVSDSLNAWSDAVATAVEGTLPVDQLLADYQIIEGSGTSLIDHSGNANHGTFGLTTNEPTWTTDGGETVLSFDGGDFCSLPDMSGDFSGSGTFVIVVKITTHPTVGGQSGSWKIGSSGTTTHYTHPTVDDIRDASLSTQLYTGGTSLVDITDWHVVFVTSTANSWIFYQNNQSVYSAGVGHAFGINTAAEIGRFSGANEMVGRIARCMLYTKVLNSTERTSLYNAIKAAKPGLGLP